MTELSFFAALRSYLALIPDTLKASNLSEIATILERIDDLCSKNHTLYHLLLPFHKLTFGWNSAYTHDFRWSDFLKDALESECTHISVDDRSVTFGNELCACVVDDD